MDSDGYEKLSARQLQELITALAPPSDKSRKRKRDDDNSTSDAAGVDSKGIQRLPRSHSSVNVL